MRTTDASIAIVSMDIGLQCRFGKSHPMFSRCNNVLRSAGEKWPRVCRFNVTGVSRNRMLICRERNLFYISIMICAQSLMYIDCIDFVSSFKE